VSTPQVSPALQPEPEPQAPRATGLEPRYLGPHLPQPDYARPLLDVPPAARERIVSHLTTLYGSERARGVYPEVERLMRVYYAHKMPEMLEWEREHFTPEGRFNERDVVLITYGDLLLERGKRPLETLRTFISVYMRDTINTVHLLPFFPSSSDRGFSIIDYEEVDPRLGAWEDIDELSRHFRLMFDGVFNHASAKSRWFQQFLNGHPEFRDFFVAFTTKEAIEPDYLKLILRPRTSSLLTPFRTLNGSRYVWTTFSPDQVDLNFKSERVLTAIIEVLLLYVRRGADIVRLDAVTFIWRELGTSCAHLVQGHALVKLFRAILDVVAPHVAIITETNVPHEDNISYFGDGTDEAQMVYNFALPPLVLHAFHRADSTILTRWAANVRSPSPTATFFNFQASHDGIGLLGARGILPPAEIDFLVQRCLEHGGLVSYRDAGGGTPSPYELNMTWWSAFNRTDVDEPQDLQVARFLATRSISLVLPGVPGVYLPSLFGAKNDTATALASRDNRAINRRAFQVESLMQMLADRGSWVRAVATGFRRLLKRRIECAAFHPNGASSVLEIDPAVFAIVRVSPSGTERVLAVTNLTARDVEIAVPRVSLGTGARTWRDLLGHTRHTVSDDALQLAMKPYEVIWLRACAR
jgi:glucosylglycerate phosphorylase